MNQDVQLQTYPPKLSSRPSQNTNTTSRVGHNNRGTSCKAKSTGENRLSTDVLDESRNNLYWVMEDTSPDSGGEDIKTLKVARLGFPCLWYGGGDEVVMSTVVEVQRLSLPECYLLSPSPEYWRKDEQLLSVERIKLLPLDEDLVMRVCREAYQPVVTHYLVALLLFAEWADSFRDSFIWPEFFVKLFTTDDEVVTLCSRASDHIFNQSEIGRDEPYWVFLFLLAAQHIGVLDQLDVEEYAASGVCTDDLTQLMKELSILRLGDPAVRSCSRVGAEYQAEEVLQSASVDEENGESLRAFVPVSETDSARLTEFLVNVQLLRERYLTVGQLIEAPLVWSEFVDLLTAEWRKRNPAIVSCGDVVQDRLALMACWTEVVTASRIAGKKLTGICAARQRLATPAASVDPTSNSATPVVPFWEADLEVVAPRGLETPEQLLLRTASLQCCRLFSVPDDVALEILQATGGDFAVALRQIEAELARSPAPRVFPVDDEVLDAVSTNVMPTPNLITLPPNEMRWFFFAAKKYYNNLRKVWRKYNKMRCRHDAIAAINTAAAAVPVNADSTSQNLPVDGQSSSSAALSAPSETSSSQETATSEPTPNTLSLGAILHVFALFFPGDNDEQFAAVAPRLSMALSVRQQQPIQWNQFATGASYNSAQSVQSSRAVQPQKLFVLKRSSSDPVLDARRDPSIPNRWPSSLPLMSHNLYWLKTSNSPCMCVGLDAAPARSGGTDGFLSVITICCATYHNAVSVQASKLEPLDEEIVKQCSDERAVGFALAMMDFADWELQSLPVDSPLRKWYVFPAFIRKFLHHMPTFAAWRKQAERAGRDFRSDRRKMYFSGLVETFNSNRIEEERDARLTMTTYPWDDSEPLIAPAEKDDGDGTASTDSNGTRSTKPRANKRKTTDSSAVESNKASRSSEVETERMSLVASKPASSGSLFNLYWVSKSSLPCLYYDSIENKFNDKITVLPVCCSSYHYPVEATQSALEPLTMELLKQCTDERTHDFTLALVDFARWETHFINTSEGHSNAGGDSSVDQPAADGESFYLWPDFILDLLNRPKEWAVWRKRAERPAAGQQGSKRQLYFEALRADYEESLATLSSGINTSSSANNSGSALDNLDTSNEV
eukprot:gene21631-27670_t